MQVTKLQAHAIIGKYAIDPSCGQQIHDLINPILEDWGYVDIDFEGVNIYTTAFFNFAIAQLLKNYPPEYLNIHLRVLNLPPYGLQLLQAVIENGKSFYGWSLRHNLLDSQP